MTLNVLRNGVCGEAVCYFLLVICSFSEILPIVKPAGLVLQMGFSTYNYR